jgi:hypothetical protein
MNDLLHEIELQETDKKIPFNWDISMYRDPPTNWDENQPYQIKDYVPQASADLESVREEATRQVDLEDAGGPINTDLSLTNIGDYVIVAPNLSADSLKRPFWVGQVCKNSKTQNKLQVHWLLPPTSASLRQGNTTGTYEEVIEPEVAQGARKAPSAITNKYKTPKHIPEERRHKPQRPNNQCLLPNYPYSEFRPVVHADLSAKPGGRKFAKQTCWISYDCVFFSFPHLGEEDTLPSNVLDAISNEEQIDWMG